MIDVKEFLKIREESIKIFGRVNIETENDLEHFLLIAAKANRECIDFTTSSRENAGRLADILHDNGYGVTWTEADFKSFRVSWRLPWR